MARGGHVPPGKFLISGLLRSLLVPFRGEPARVGRPTSNLVIVFERSHNLKAWLRFAPRRGKIFLASYCMYSFSRCSVELRDTNTVCHRILSYLLWYSTMVSVGRSVRSYVCADLLSTREGSLSKGGAFAPPLPPLDPPLPYIIYDISGSLIGTTASRRLSLHCCCWQFSTMV